MKKEYDILLKAIKAANKIVFFGGAGVSTASGIKDFRSKEGLYNLKSKYGVPYEVILSHDYFTSYPSTFFEFYRNFMINLTAKPNSCHEFLSMLENEKSVTIITQNIDGLHQLAGSKNVIELHGSIYRNYCEKCGRMYPVDVILNSVEIPHCPVCGGIIKPDVVLYDEPLLETNIAKALIKIQEADLLIVAGTSLRVYPAANMINYFFGDNIFVINKEKLDIRKRVKLVMNDDIEEIFNYLKDVYHSS
ncbi:MAG: NAD-dependent protein deacylase [Bacilli bacterium]